MEYRVRVSPGVKKEEVVVAPDGRYLISVNAPRKEGRANERAKELLASHLGIPGTSLHLVRGHTSATKIFRRMKI